MLNFNTLIIIIYFLNDFQKIKQINHKQNFQKFVGAFISLYLNFHHKNFLKCLFRYEYNLIYHKEVFSFAKSFK